MALGSLSRERWAVLEPLLDAALELEPASRRAFVDEKCRSDPVLHAELGALLTACDLGDALLARPASIAYAPLLAGARRGAPLAGHLPDRRLQAAAAHRGERCRLVSLDMLHGQRTAGRPPADFGRGGVRQVATGGSELPFTGFLAIPLLVVGVAFLVTGGVIRSRSSGDRTG